MSKFCNQKLVFRSWALRGKSHVIRLIMEHLDIAYQDVIYKTPKSWYIDPLSKQNHIEELPCIQDQDFIVSETIPILGYILKKFGCQKYLGESIQDQALVDMYLWSTEMVFRKIIRMSLNNTGSLQDFLKIKQDLWKRTIQPKLQSIQNFLVPGKWYLDYLSVIDFDLYQLAHYLRILYPLKVQDFPKIQKVGEKIGQLHAVRTYNNSSRNRNLCFLPIQMCKRFKDGPEKV